MPSQSQQQVSNDLQGINLAATLPANTEGEYIAEVGTLFYVRTKAGHSIEAIVPMWRARPLNPQQQSQREESQSAQGRQFEELTRSSR